MAAANPLPPPTNQLVQIVNTVLDFLILGLGEKAAIAAATAQAPWLSLPIISWIFSSIVAAVASSIDTNIKKNVDIVIIRFQNDVRKIEYDQTIALLNKTPSDPAAIQAAQDALNLLINRNK